MTFITGRALHYVFKIPDRKQTALFYREILGMKVLRHEEFADGCEAACNGPYANRWSKTMVGYGPESNHFVVELTYNYGIKEYETGNDFLGITIKSSEVLKRAKAQNWPILNGNTLKAPGGYKFHIIDEPQPTDSDGPVHRAKAYGRIAFACPFDEQPAIAQKIEDHKQTILTPLISLDTPGKATVRVIILADPDGHEICFVDEEGFSQLSQVDPEGDKLLDRYIEKDKS
ncbi:glyoxalase domain-containing protein 4 [Asbolus verrucosus]|uniref:Glyoxalase domain-containing protein 4 n=1 Tax=Asbolus verrucosus TaxID=1661398 RepID=A0A482V7Y5_ASBVE|nr:glyoxalase domain-containing protein 4 [Asbolus verrucosus]